MIDDDCAILQKDTDFALNEATLLFRGDENKKAFEWLTTIASVLTVASYGPSPKVLSELLKEIVKTFDEMEEGKKEILTRDNY